MNSAALLDLLGNENRRRILRLLAQKPCYVTEISEYLGVSPKAVIDHLRKLEEAGLVESRVDEGRRKYFHITRNIRLEVNVSPYRFGAKSAYPASVGLDMTRCRHLKLNLGDGGDEDDGRPGPEPDADTDVDPEAGTLARRLRRLEELEDELSMAQRWVQGRLTEVLDDLADRVDDDVGVDSRLYADVLLALDAGAVTVPEVTDRVGASPEAVERALFALADAGLARRLSDGWTLD
jgi:ArsR family transcriptional regulator